MTRAPDALRLLLGSVMAITALAYFLPFLVPFVPAAAWNDPMAARLMAAFDKSGLLAVAKFIHLAGGAMLLANRGVPLALAALMPVNLCGLFISLLIAGDPLLATLAIITVALNALLMLTYLSYYRGVLEKGALADGEGPEAGHNYESLFVNPLSSAPPAAYLGGIVVLAAALAFYWFIVPFANGTTGLVTLIFPSVVFLIGIVRGVGGRKLDRREDVPFLQKQEFGKHDEPMDRSRPRSFFRRQNRE